MTKDLVPLFERDLDKLAEEINAYANEKELWLVQGQIKNSAGNLCLHLTGNLNHFFGAVLGKTGYIRKRDEEFAKKDVPRSDLLKEIERVKIVVTDTLKKMNDQELDTVFPVEVFGFTMTTRYFLYHLYGHLNYHLGQVNYHRRLTASSHP